jgi:hypothetical protein
LKGTFVTCSLAGVTSYAALSYTWGNVADTPYSIRLGHASLFIRENLWLALQAILKLRGELLIWIDAVCINQTDTEERNQQVELMGLIYRNAREVLAWLGQGDASTDRALQFVKDLCAHHKETDWVSSQIRHSDVANNLIAIAQLLQRPYWGRMWVTQELTLGSHVTLICGNSVMNISQLAFFQECVNTLRIPQGTLLLNHVFRDQPELRVDLIWRGVRPIWELRKQLQADSLSIFSVLQYNLNKLATDPKDMVYGIRSLVSDLCMNHLGVNYHLSTAEVFASAVRAEVEVTGKLDIITSVLWGITCCFTKPSWVPDWSAHRRGHTRLQTVYEPYFKYRSSGDSRAIVNFSPCGQCMTMQAIHLGTITDLGKTTKMSSHADLLNAVVAFSSWSDLLYTKSLTDITSCQSFGQTLLANRFRAEEFEDLRLSRPNFLTAFVGAWADLMASMKEVELTVIPFHRKLRADKSQIMESSADTTRNLGLWIQDSCRYIWDRRFVLIGDGIMGLVPEATLQGDLVYLPLGCSHPVVLRPGELSYQLIGEAYVNGFMDGEAMNGLATEMYILQAVTVR